MTVEQENIYKEGHVKIKDFWWSHIGFSYCSWTVQLIYKCVCVCVVMCTYNHEVYNFENLF